MAGTVENLIQIFKSIPPGKKISFAISLIIVMGGFAAILMYTNRPDYQVLFANLDSGDAAKISDQLNGKQIQYQLSDGGSTILVPSDKVYQLRLELASEGIPAGGTVGFEVFDDISFGTTDFVQKLKYQQALQGELARTIMEFDSVEQARVHIVAAGDSLFAEPENPATASVVIRAKGGNTLDKRQLQGIINLVACAVEGLKLENITIVDMAGGLLSKGQEEDSIENLSMTQFEYRKNFEESLEKRIRTMLEPVVGANMVVARVSAEIDFQRVSTSEEKVDPDNYVIRSEEKLTESSTEDSSLPSGSPDLQYQVYNTTGESGVQGNHFSKENTVTNYEISKVITQTVNSVGDIKRLSVAVFIDGPYVMQEDANGNMVETFVPRERKEMTMFEDMVMKAIGYDEAREDEVSVENVVFRMKREEAVLAVTDTNWLDYLQKGSKTIINVLLIIVFFLLAVRPFKRLLSQTGDYVNTMALREGEAGSVDSRISEIEERHQGRQQLMEATKNNPDIAANIIKSWINEVS